MLQLVRRGAREVELEAQAAKEAKRAAKLNPAAMQTD